MAMFSDSSAAPSELEDYKKSLIAKHKQPLAKHMGDLPAATAAHVVRVKDWVQLPERELGIKVDVVAQRGQIPLSQIPAQGLPQYGQSLNALTLGDRIVLLANAIETHEQALAAYRQEVVGRYGVRLLLGKRLSGVAQQVFDSLGEARLAYLNEQLGFTFDWADTQDQQAAALEHIARLAAVGRSVNRVQRRLSFYRAVARFIGWHQPWTHDDLCVLIDRARRTLSA